MKSVEFNNLTKQDFDKMTFKEIRHLVSQEGQKANKRVKNIEANKGKVSQSAVGQVKRSGGKFHTTGKTTKTELIKEAKRIQTFNKKKASTVSGAREVAKEVLKAKGIEPKKKKKNPKSLKKIKSDINKKYQKIKAEKGKEEADKYKKRAMPQYKSIQKKRREKREVERLASLKPKRESDSDGSDDSYNDKAEDDINDFDDFSSDDLDDGAFSGKRIEKSTNNSYDDAKKREQEQQDFMPDASKDWSSRFI